MKASRLTIIVNARFLTQQVTGVQRFGIEISKELKQDSLNFIFVAPRNVIHKDLGAALGVRKVGFLKGHLWEQFVLPFFVWRKKGILLSLCNTAPLFHMNQIITIHDLCFMTHPEWFSKKFALFYNFLIPKIASNSKKIITVSKTSKKEIIDKLRVESHKVIVANNAVSKVFREEFSKNVKGEDKSTKRYILTVSSIHPRKNFKRLIKAFNLLEDNELYLYIIGNYSKQFFSEDFSNDLTDRVKFIKDVSDKDLIEYYKNAQLFVYPSLYEGFGIPIIEAASLGTKVCVSNIPVFKEICEDNALYFDPYNVDDIKEKIKEGLHNSSINENWDISRYNWKNSAKLITKTILNEFQE